MTHIEELAIDKMWWWKNSLQKAISPSMTLLLRCVSLSCSGIITVHGYVNFCLLTVVSFNGRFLLIDSGFIWWKIWFLVFMSFLKWNKVWNNFVMTFVFVNSMLSSNGLRIHFHFCFLSSYYRRMLFPAFSPTKWHIEKMTWFDIFVLNFFGWKEAGPF